MKSKVITAADEVTLQNAINDFLYSIPFCEVKFITQSALSNDFVTVIIFYITPNK